MKILGLWDGHDSGAALVQDGKIVFAVNEERLTRRKLEIHFPRNSIREVFRQTQSSPASIDLIVASTTDPSKALSRLLPGTKERYYLLRRRKVDRPLFFESVKSLKQKLTCLPPNIFSTAVSKWCLKQELMPLDLRSKPLQFVDHHTAHAASAAYCSGFHNCAVLSFDGVGDGCSGAIFHKRGTTLTPLQWIPPKYSPGLFFEEVTSLLNMRELEDEGKVMALASYARESTWDANPLRQFCEDVHGSSLINHSTRAFRKGLRDLFWRSSPEEFAYFAQQALEHIVTSVARSALRLTGENVLAYAGGVASNVKANLLIRELPEVQSLFVAPHMGDGGLALGSALFAAAQHGSPLSQEPLTSVAIGPSFSEQEIADALSSRHELVASKSDDIPSVVADLLARDEIVFWFQGALELGPRSLGQRSILARPDKTKLRDLLNHSLKRRGWYQPFCPSLLQEEAFQFLRDYHGEPAPFMTVAYRTMPLCPLEGVMHIDGTCRPQVVQDRHSPFGQLLLALRERLGYGVVLNTSYNLHGEPVVCTPAEAISTFLRSGARFLALGPYLVTRK